MTRPLPDSFDDLSCYARFTVDLVACGPRSLVVRDRTTGREAEIGYDDRVHLGPNHGATGYELILPAWMATVRGLSDAH